MSTSIKHESHLRSLLKGISWRVVATGDTVLVVLLVTALHGQPSLRDALAIGTAEFLIKFLAYYGHERLWEGLRPAGEITQAHTLKKSISWRLVATTMTFVISGVVLDSFDQVALYIALTELFSKFALYYLHERAWLKIPLGKVRAVLERQAPQKSS